MTKRFKTKRRLKIGKPILYIIIAITIFLGYKFIMSLNRININNNLLDIILNENNIYDNKKQTLMLSYSKSKINNPTSILTNDLAFNETKNKENNKSHQINNTDIKVYIYNSHQKEGYSIDYVEDYNVVPDVLVMSHIMQEKLEKLGINTLVEENDITSYLNKNKLDYSKSYEASRYYLKQVLNKYNDLKLIIDLHRDATSHKTSTVEIDGKNCAKILFVVGKEYDTYEDNLNVSNSINNKIKEKYPDLTRGVLQKEGEYVNGVYNQDLNPNIILLELGGNNNNIDELTNTIDLIIPIIGEYINER